MALINTFKTELEKPFIGREEEALVITLALTTMEHVVLIGEPGTAKSAMARRAADLLKARFSNTFSPSTPSQMSYWDQLTL